MVVCDDDETHLLCQRTNERTNERSGEYTNAKSAGHHLVWFGSNQIASNGLPNGISYLFKHSVYLFNVISVG